MNATGNQKIVPVVIGSTKKPHCFQHKQLCILYFHQKNAWNDMKFFVKWWDDGFSGHDRNVKNSFNGQVTMFVFPPNVTVYQPMDQGIIATLKTGYKSSVLS